MKKSDLILIAIAVIILIPIALLLVNTKSGDKALVKSDGKTIDVLDLSVDGTYRYENKYGYNIVEVKDKIVRVIEADCPGHDCINKGFIKRNNESVICLPHRFEVIITSDKEEYDVLVQ